MLPGGGTASISKDKKPHQSRDGPGQLGPKPSLERAGPGSDDALLPAHSHRTAGDEERGAAPGAAALRDLCPQPPLSYSPPLVERAGVRSVLAVSCYAMSSEKTLTPVNFTVSDRNDVESRGRCSPGVGRSY